MLSKDNPASPLRKIVRSISGIMSTNSAGESSDGRVSTVLPEGSVVILSYNQYVRNVPAEAVYARYALQPGAIENIKHHLTQAGLAGFCSEPYDSLERLNISDVAEGLSVCIDSMNPRFILVNCGNLHCIPGNWLQHNGKLGGSEPRYKAHASVNLTEENLTNFFANAFPEIIGVLNKCCIKQWKILSLDSLAAAISAGDENISGKLLTLYYQGEPEFELALNEIQEVLQTKNIAPGPSARGDFAIPGIGRPYFYGRTSVPINVSIYLKANEMDGKQSELTKLTFGESRNPLTAMWIGREKKPELLAIAAAELYSLEEQTLHKPLAITFSFRSLPSVEDVASLCSAHDSPRHGISSAGQDDDYCGSAAVTSPRFLSVNRHELFVCRVAPRTVSFRKSLEEKVSVEEMLGVYDAEQVRTPPSQDMSGTPLTTMPGLDEITMLIPELPPAPEATIALAPIPTAQRDSFMTAFYAGNFTIPKWEARVSAQKSVNRKV